MRPAKIIFSFNFQWSPKWLEAAKHILFHLKRFPTSSTHQVSLTCCEEFSLSSEVLYDVWKKLCKAKKSFIYLFMYLLFKEEASIVKVRVQFNVLLALLLRIQRNEDTFLLLQCIHTKTYRYKYKEKCKGVDK